MIVNDIVTGIIAVVIGYLLGSVPAAYIVTRIVTGKDIRQLGGGNVGTRNTYVQAGLAAAIVVAVFDIGKGTAAVVIAHYLLDVPYLFVLTVGVAAVAGHMWPIYLKFTGGNGLATTIGTLSLLMPRELLIALALTLLFIIITRNAVLSVNISLLSVLVSLWLLEEAELRVALFIFSIVLLLMMVFHFLPTAKAALAKAGSRENLFAELRHKEKAKS
ncbi:MAG: glycerol-3-phosphate acyltransferase [Chloroflexota bacterium]